MNKETSKWYTLITGASQGIGRSLAHECAARGMNLLLVALPNDHLEATAQDIRQHYPVEVHTFGVDLTANHAPQAIFDWCSTNHFAVNVLINNAGIGAVGRFDTLSHQQYETMIRLNVLATVSLTRLFLPGLQEAPRSYILNMGSAAAFFNIPHKIIYSASKAFVFSFSRALREELQGTGVSITVACPGPVNTSEIIRHRAQMAGFFGRLSMLEPDFVAKAALGGLLRGKAVVAPGISAKIFRMLNWVSPYVLKMKVAAFIFRKGEGEAPPATEGALVPEQVNH